MLINSTRFQATQIRPTAYASIVLQLGASCFCERKRSVASGWVRRLYVATFTISLPAVARQSLAGSYAQ